MKLSVVVIHYKTFELTKNTLTSVFQHSYPWQYEVVLVDNASQDGSVERLKEVFCHEICKGKLLVIENEENLGFAKANNIGARRSTGEYLLLLNSDTKVLESTLPICVEKIESDPSLGALGCKVLLEDGRLDEACKRGFPTPSASLYYFLGLDKKNPINYGQYHALHLAEDEVGEVDSITGAFMLMKKSVFDELGGFDEDYFMYAEDIDLCYRLKQKGYKVLYYPETSIVHYKGGSGKKRKKGVLRDFHETMWIFYKKHYIGEYPFYVTMAVYLGIRLKYVLALLKNALKE